MHTDLDKIKERIRRCLNLAERSDVEGEVNAAMAAATQLMSSYHLTREDIVRENGSTDCKEVVFGDAIAFTYGERLTGWQSSLANFCCDFIGSCKAYITRNVPRRINGVIHLDHKGGSKGSRITFYGPLEDAVFAAELFHEVCVATATAGRLRWGGFSHGAGGAYCEGFVAGLKSANIKEMARLEAHSESRSLVLRSKETALALRTQAEGWLERERKVRLGKPGKIKGVNTNVNKEAYAEGKEDGKNYEVGKPTSRPKLADARKREND